MKHIATFIIFIFVALLPVKADLILLRDGSEILASVQQISDDRIVYQINRNDIGRFIDTRDVYMIKFDKRGNIYITPDRKRISGENRPIPRGVDLVYLVDGAEFIAYNLHVGVDKISFLPSKPNKKSLPVAQEYDRNQVFKIKYADGTIDIITSLLAPPPAPVAETPEVNQTEPQPEFQVIFHTVEKRETLASIGEKFDVSPDDIIKWNELSPKTRHTSFLTPGLQLMLYVKP